MTSKAFGLAQLGNAFDDGALSNRNKIINGAMVIDQRNAGAEISPAPSGYTVDRFATFKSGAGTFKVQQSTDAPASFSNSLLLTVTGASTPSGGDYYILQHPIEGQNLSVLSLGTANAQTSTLSFYVKSSLTGTFSGSLRDNPSSVSYVFEYTINSANTWERKSVTISGSTSGTFPTGNTAGAKLVFSLGQGTTYATPTVGSWVSGNYHGSTTETDFIATNGATFYITGVQLEAGDTATPFEHRSYGQELALCQRYYEFGTYKLYVGGNGANLLIGRLTYKTTKRATPTITYNSTGIAGGYHPPTATGAASVNGIDAELNGTEINFGYTASAEL